MEHVLLFIVKVGDYFLDFRKYHPHLLREMFSVFGNHLFCHHETFRCERIIVVEVVEFFKIFEVNFRNVPFLDFDLRYIYVKNVYFVFGSFSPKAAASSPIRKDYWRLGTETSISFSTRRN